MKNPKLYTKIVAFPTIILYLEVLLHLFTGYSLKYLPLYFFFCICYGAFFTLIAALFGKKRFNLVMKILIGIVTVLFGAELVVNKIFQVFYPFSILKTAAGNHLSEFLGETIRAIIASLPGIILMLVPFVLSLFLLGKHKPRHSKNAKTGHEKKTPKLKHSAVIILSLVLCLVSYLVNIGIIYLIPSKADVTPKQLYTQDTGFVEQTEQLGLLTMLKIDIRHIIFGASSSSEFVGPSGFDDGPATEDEIDYGFNTMEWDFDAMMNGSSKKDIQWLVKYVSSGTPTKKNQYTGTMKDYNVIFLTLEGFSGYGVDKELTPTLYKMSHECFVFDNFYTALHFTSTSNGECQNLLGLYPKNGFPISMQEVGYKSLNCYFSLAQQLNRLGYASYGFHNNQYNLYNRRNSHTQLGYTYYAGDTKDGKFVLEQSNPGKWPQKDSVMIDNTVSLYATPDQPFNVYYITISGHTPYSSGVYSGQDFIDTVKAKHPEWSDSTQGYMATCMEVDKAMEHLINELDKAGKLENTLIVAAPDHVPYGNVEILEELAGTRFGDSSALSNINESQINFDVYKSMLIMWNSKLAKEEPVEIHKPCCQVDLLPTISNLLGLEYDSRMLSGTDLLSDSEGLVVFSSKCWKSGKGFYNRFTQEFTPIHGEFGSQQEMDDYVAAMKAIVANKLDCTAKIVDNNFYDYAVQYLKK